MNTHERESVALEEVLEEFVLAGGRPDRERLLEFVRRFPEHREKLVEFATWLALVGTDDGESELDAVESASVARAMSRFENRLYELEQERVVVTPQRASGEIFSALTTPEAVDEFAGRMHCNRMFFSRMKDSLIEAESLTPGFQSKLADELDVPIELVASHFRRPAAAPAQLRRKAHGKPASVKKQSFEEAVRSSGLTDEQQRWLLDL
jgi:hypothetical protein